MTKNQHHLEPLLRPSSIAVVGASERPHSVGRRTMENLLTGGFEGELYAVNPGYDSICGVPCHPDLASLPQTVDHVALTIGDTRIEAALDGMSDARLSESEAEQFYRLLGSYRGLSEALIDYAGCAGVVDWDRWREEKFA